MTILFLVLWLLSLAAFSLLVSEVLRVTRELEQVNSENTNAMVTSATAWRPIRRLVRVINGNLQRTRELQRKQQHQDAEVKQMLTNLTHDIKTPLTVASGYVQVMQESATSPDPRLVRIGRNLSAVNYYLRTLMNYDEMIEKHAKLVLTPLDLSQVVQDELFSAYDELNERGIQVTPNIAPNISLITDETAIRRILQNLIGNWLKYAQNQAAIALDQPDSKHITLKLSNQTNEKIADPSKLESRFYTGDASRSDGSTGLGLNIVSALMTQLGGRMLIKTASEEFAIVLTFFVDSQEG